MAAGVHKAVVDAFKCTTGLLLDAQSVHIRPQRHCFARLADLGDKAGGLQPAIGYPSSSKAAATLSVVRNSWKLASGCMWRSRRKAMVSSLI